MPRLSWSVVLDHLEEALPGGCLVLLFLSVFVAPAFVPICILLCLMSSMWLVGERLAPQAGYLRPLLGIVTLLASQSLLQTAWYYLGGSLGRQSDAFSLGIPLLLFFIWNFWQRPITEDPPDSPLAQFLAEARWSIPLLFIGEDLLGLILLFAHGAATTNAINSPWPLLPAGVLAAVFLLSLTTWIAGLRVRHPLTIAALVGTFFLSVSVLTPLIYTQGFGFDGFLHRASELVLGTTGTLTPKPPYYLGQYVFVTWLDRITGIGIPTIDRWLVPLFAALLPLFGIAKTTRPGARWTLVLLGIFLPLSIVITTTPQSFAYLLGLAGLLCAWALRTQPAPETRTPLSAMVPALLLAGWSLATHPLAGLPLAAATFGILWHDVATERSWRSWLRRTGLIMIAFFASVGVPLAFAINSQLSAHHIDWHLERLGQASVWREIGAQLISQPLSHLALWPDWADTTTWLTRFFVLIGIVVALWRKESGREKRVFLTVTSIGLSGAAILLAQTGEFTFLIGYERGNYAERLFLLAILVVLPVTLDGWSVLWERISRGTPFTMAIWMIFLSAYATGQVYQALPRHDAGMIGHGWSVGQADIDAVRFIEKDAQQKPYTVLANQSVSAAAVSQLGFKRYAGDVFFYPIPTGGPLYQLFLEATTKPSLVPIQAAATLGQSSRVYLVLNRYWWNADQVREAFETLADRAWSVRNGDVTIFQFNVTSTASNR